jgi:hypothetical protein
MSIFELSKKDHHASAQTPELNDKSLNIPDDLVKARILITNN